GEARYAFRADTSSVEFGLSVGDPWQGLGIGKTLLRYLERQAISFGAELIFGETLRSNHFIVGHANRFGYVPSERADEWRLVRFEKRLLQSSEKDTPRVG